MSEELLPKAPFAYTPSGRVAPAALLAIPIGAVLGAAMLAVPAAVVVGVLEGAQWVFERLFPDGVAAFTGIAAAVLEVLLGGAAVGAGAGLGATVAGAFAHNRSPAVGGALAAAVVAALTVPLAGWLVQDALGVGGTVAMAGLAAAAAAIVGVYAGRESAYCEEHGVTARKRTAPLAFPLSEQAAVRDALLAGDAAALRDLAGEGPVALVLHVCPVGGEGWVDAVVRVREQDSDGRPSERSHRFASVRADADLITTLGSPVA